MNDVREKCYNIKVGDKIAFSPGSHTRNRWTVGARSDRYIVAVRQVAFKPKGMCEYCVVDTQWNGRYNGVEPGVARSSLATLGGGFPISLDDIEGLSQNVLAELTDERMFSLRRILAVRDITVN